MGSGVVLVGAVLVVVDDLRCVGVWVSRQLKIPVNKTTHTRQEPTLQLGARTERRHRAVCLSYALDCP